MLDALHRILLANATKESGSGTEPENGRLLERWSRRAWGLARARMPCNWMLQIKNYGRRGKRLASFGDYAGLE